MSTDLPTPTLRPGSGWPPLPGRGCDCRSCAFWAGPDGTGGPATVEPLCSGTNSSCSYCGCARTEVGSPQGACGQCPIRCGSRTDITAWMTEVGGTLGFGDITLDCTLPAGLPSFVPQVDGSNIPQMDAELGWPAYGIGLRRVFSPATHEIYPRLRGRTAHEALGLRSSQLAVLVGYGEDPLVEAFWTRRHTRGLIEQIAAQGWDLVLAPNYSIYGSWPRTEHLLNMRRSLLVAKELCDAGVTAVPNVYWYRLEDLRRWAAWITETAPTAVAINLQTVRQGGEWESWTEPGLYWLAEHLREGVRVILTGLSRADRLALAVQLFGQRLVVVSQNAYQYALHGAVMTEQGRVDVHARSSDAFATTVRYMAGLLPDNGQVR
jgi:hypothetical protein